MVSNVLPNLIVIGAAKCGTSSLHYYMNLHPQISMSKEKELRFFVEEKNWHKGTEWYQSNFTGRTKIRGESSPVYTQYPHYAGVPKRMCSLIPEAKLIYIVRDPIERITSHYTMSYLNGKETRSMSDALADSNNRYINDSKYYMQLEQYLQYYPTSQILIVTLEELYTNISKPCRRYSYF